MRERWPFRRTAAVLAAVAAVVAIVVTGLVRLETDTSPTTFVPADDPSVRSLVDSEKSFGGDPLVVIAETARSKRLLDQEQLPKLFRLEGDLANLDGVASVYGPATVLNQIAGSMQNLLAALSGKRDALKARAVAEARREGVRDPKELERIAAQATRKHDLRYGKLLVRGLPAGLPTLRNPRFVERVIFSTDGTPRAQWHFVVPTSDSVGITIRPKEGLDQAELKRLVSSVHRTIDKAGLDTERVVVAGVPGVTVGLAEQVEREIPLLGALALVGIAGCYLLLPWMRRRRARLVPLAVTLASTALVLAGFGWLGRPLSLGVIAFLPILLGIASDFPAYLAQRGSRRPVLVAAGASAAAFAALAASPVPFVRELGLSLAVGQLLAVGLMLLLIQTGVGAEASEEETGAEEAPSPPAPLGLRRRVAVVVAAGLVALLGWLSLSSLTVQADPTKLAAGLEAIEDAQHAERVFGGAGELKLLVRGDDMLSPTALAWMREAEEKIVRERGSTLRPIMSLPNLMAFLGDEPTSQQIRAALDLMPSYLTRAVVTEDAERASMSFQLSLQDLGDQARLIRDIRASLPEPPPGVDVDVVGMPVVAARGYELMADDRYVMALAGIAAAAPVLLLGLRRKAVALQALLAAILASGWGLALASLLGVELTPLTAALGSLTAAIACEYAVVMAPIGRARGMYRTVIAAAAAAGIGYLSLAFSALDVLSQFGLILAASVALSLAAAHVVVRVFTPDAGVDGRMPSKAAKATKAAEPAEAPRPLEMELS